MYNISHFYFKTGKLVTITFQKYNTMKSLFQKISIAFAKRKFRKERDLSINRKLAKAAKLVLVNI